MRHQDRCRVIRAVIAAGIAIAVLTVVGPSSSMAAEPIATLRGGPIPDAPTPPRMPAVENRDLKRVRSYPEQPPIIPHSIRDYQVDVNANKCMTCHSRTAVERSQAPMISVTHFMDRDGQVLGVVSPRRYFCNQCHVTQVQVRPLIENTFKDVDAVVHDIKKGE